MIYQLLEAMSKYQHVCPEVEMIRCPLCQERWEYEKQKLRHHKKRNAKLRRQQEQHLYY